MQSFLLRHSKGAAPLAKLLEYVYAEFDRIGLDHDLVQMVPNPPSKDKTKRLMQRADMLVVTGSQSNVRSAYSSGTLAIGVGMGNVVTIIDEPPISMTQRRKSLGPNVSIMLHHVRQKMR